MVACASILQVVVTLCIPRLPFLGYLLVGCHVLQKCWSALLEAMRTIAFQHWFYTAAMALALRFDLAKRV